MTDLVATGVFKLFVPTEYGGAQAHVADAVDAIESVAYHDGSTGWCVMIGLTTGLCAGFMPAEHAAAVFGCTRRRRRRIRDARPAPPWRSTVDICVSGRWSWGSGTDHCTAIGGGVFVVDTDGKPAALADGTRAPFVFFDR